MPRPLPNLPASTSTRPIVWFTNAALHRKETSLIEMRLHSVFLSRLWFSLSSSFLVSPTLLFHLRTSLSGTKGDSRFREHIMLLSALSLCTVYFRDRDQARHGLVDAGILGLCKNLPWSESQSYPAVDIAGTCAWGGSCGGMRVQS